VEALLVYGWVIENSAMLGTAAVVTGELATGTMTPLSAPVTSSTRVVEQYALRAAASGWFPVMTRGCKLPTAITWLNKGEIWKIGITKNPLTRYTQQFLRTTGTGVEYTTEFKGTLDEVRSLEQMKILNELKLNDILYPGNKIICSADAHEYINYV
jgi:hypothetical protein